MIFGWSSVRHKLPFPNLQNEPNSGKSYIKLI